MTDLVDFQQLQNLGLAQSAASAAEPQDVTQDEFLTLLLAQLENQDPLEPMDNTEFLSQLAEVTTASGIGELQASFDSFSSTIYADQALQASSLVGRNVMVASELARTDTAGQPISGAVDLENSSGQVTLDILDASGQLVRSIDLGVRRAG
ncbi:MAG: flagellar hook capping FlgD N-terminal domain-containing protein, partial [Pseudomonadota bacterium]